MKQKTICSHESYRLDFVSQDQMTSEQPPASKDILSSCISFWLNGQLPDH